MTHALSSVSMILLLPFMELKHFFLAIGDSYIHPSEIYPGALSWWASLYQEGYALCARSLQGYDNNFVGLDNGDGDDPGGAQDPVRDQEGRGQRDVGLHRLHGGAGGGLEENWRSVKFRFGLKDSTLFCYI